MPRDDLTKTIIITGAGSGFGAEIARHYASLGWTLALTDQVEERVVNLLAELNKGNEAQHAKSFAMRLNVTSDRDWDRLCDHVKREWPGVGILVNNAGVAVGGNIETTSMDDWQWVIDIDLIGVARGCHHFAKAFKDQGYGHIVNIASVAGFAGAPDIVAYGVAKAGVISLSESLRAEMAPANVGVTVVCPAFVRTRLTETMRVGDAALKSQVERWMDTSGVSASDVASQIAAAVKQRQFMLLTHKKTRGIWRFKRFLPERYFKTLLKRTRAFVARQGA